MLKVSENPPARWPVDRSISADLGKWGVLRVKPRAEKALAWELARNGIPYYLPMLTKRSVRRDNGKTRKSLICLFPGYIALTDWHIHKEAVLRTGRVLRIITVPDQEKFTTELTNISLAIRQFSELEVHPHLVLGERVLISKGPLAGIEGLVADISQPGKVFLNVEMFNRALVLKVEPGEILPVENRVSLNSSVELASGIV